MNVDLCIMFVKFVYFDMKLVQIKNVFTFFCDFELIMALTLEKKK